MEVEVEVEEEAMSRIASSRDWKTILTCASLTKIGPERSSGFAKAAGKKAKASRHNIVQITMISRRR